MTKTPANCDVRFRPEAGEAARHMGMEICGISCITNMAAGISEEHLDHKEVQETADRVAETFRKLITKVVVNI